MAGLDALTATAYASAAPLNGVNPTAFASLLAMENALVGAAAGLLGGGPAGVATVVGNVTSRGTESLTLRTGVTWSTRPSPASRWGDGQRLPGRVARSRPRSRPCVTSETTASSGQRRPHWRPCPTCRQLCPLWMVSGSWWVGKPTRSPLWSYSQPTIPALLAAVGARRHRTSPRTYPSI
jgi:hypothetical protein